VVLSGCATGDGRELRGEGVLGLTYGFLANGSNTVVASLWPVEDALTARFMEEFYTAYRASGTRSTRCERAIAHPQQDRTHCLVEFRGALQRTALIGRAPARILTTRIQHCAERLAWLRVAGWRRACRGKPPAIRYKCHDPAISPTCGRIRETFFQRTYYKPSRRNRRSIAAQCLRH
jgi:hypothetical protein